MVLGAASIYLAMFTNGALNAVYRPDVAEKCAKAWWRNLLYMNNFFGNANLVRKKKNRKIKFQCYGISWYLSVDFQLHIAAPLILVPLFVWFKASLVLSAVAMVAHIAMTYAYYFTDSNLIIDEGAAWV